jgi:hypothetical protein
MLVALFGAPGQSDERAVVPADERALSTPGVGDTHRDPTPPGLHGTRLDAVTYGGQSLQHAAVNRLGYVPGQPFTVTLTNEGENDEFNVKVSVRIRPVDGDAVTLSQMLPAVTVGEQGTVELALDRKPPIARAAHVDVTVAKVPGELTDDPQDNNQLSFPVLFSDGPSPPAATPEPSRTATRSDAAAEPVPVTELRDTDAVRADLASGGELARAWNVPSLKGHVHLIRTPDRWCLSAPDPATDQPEIERGKTCTDAATFAERGIQLGIGSTAVSVGPGPDAPLLISG